MGHLSIISRSGLGMGVCLVLLMNSCGPQRASAPLKNSVFNQFLQKKENWCWAAATQAAVFLKKNQYWSQCQIVSQSLGQDCCAENAASLCAQSYFTQRSLRDFGVPFELSSPGLKHTISSLKKGFWVVSKWQHRSERRAHVWIWLGVEKFDKKTYFRIFDPQRGVLRISKDGELKDWMRKYSWHSSLRISI
jgi:hypothetical protein